MTLPTKAIYRNKFESKRNTIQQYRHFLEISNVHIKVLL